MDVINSKTKTNDKLVRVKLIEDLLADGSDSRIIEEFEIERGKSRADIVKVVDGGVHAFEIKSDIDTLTRLPRQVGYYSKVFSTVTLVVGFDHVVDALYLIPDWWGVVVARIEKGTLEFSTIRDAKQNQSIDCRSVSTLFRKAELVKLLDSCSPGVGRWTMSKAKLVDEAHRELHQDLFIDKLSSALLKRSNGYKSFSSVEVLA